MNRALLQTCIHLLSNTPLVVCIVFPQLIACRVIVLLYLFVIHLSLSHLLLRQCFQFFSPDGLIAILHCIS